MRIKKIISGGQTGVDLAALDAAICCGVEYGGWCPQGRINENGKIDKRYTELREISGTFQDEKENYDARTQLNIRYSNATLILVPKKPLPAHIKDGTLLTIQEAKKQNKPYLILDLSEPVHDNLKAVSNWITECSPEILNIAGPRESSCPGIYQSSFNFLKQMIFEHTHECVSSPRAKL